MSEPSDLKINKSTKILLAVGGLVGAVVLPILLDLVMDSNAYASLKQSKPIDAILSLSISVNISGTSILLSLLLLSLLGNYLLVKRMNLYYQAAEKFAEYFYLVGAKYREATGHPVVFSTRKGEIEIGELPGTKPS